MPSLDLQSRPRLAPNLRLQTDRVTGDPVLLYPEGVLVLNPSAHEIVTRCDGHTTVEQIIARLAAEYEAPAGELQADVLECLADLSGRNFILTAP